MSAIEKTMNNIILDNPPRPARKKAGFTIVELLAVVAVMAILAGIVLGIAGYAARRASDAQARADLEKLRNALEEYRLYAARYPQANMTNNVQWSGFISALPASLSNHWAEVQIEDPWGRPYRYETLGRYTFALWSLGPTTNTYDIIR